MSKAFSDRRAPEERKKIIKDNKMFSFCLLHGTDDVCFAKMTNTKPPCPMPECNKQHIRWLHEILLLESNTDKTASEGSINVVSDCGGWRTPDESWLNLEAAEGEDVYFVNICSISGTRRR
jgi:Fic family protein